MKRLLMPVALITATVAMLLLAACGKDDGTASEPTAIPATVTLVPSLTPTAIPTPAPTPTVTGTPAVTPTPITTVSPSYLLRIDSFTCQRFFPGVPNPDGPNEWLNVSGEITNLGSTAIDFSVRPSAITVEVLDHDGELVTEVVLRFSSPRLAPDESAGFEADPVNEAFPTANTCELKFDLGHEYALSTLGEREVDVEIFAAP